MLRLTVDVRREELVMCWIPDAVKSLEYKRRIEQVSWNCQPPRLDTAVRHGASAASINMMLTDCTTGLQLQMVMEMLMRTDAVGQPTQHETHSVVLPTPEPELVVLSARELEVLHLDCRGRTNREIAAELSISHRTVSTHVEHILRKLQVSTRAEAAAYATRHRLV